MPTGFVVLGAVAASWGLFKDIVSVLRRGYDGKSAIPAILLRFENDCCLMTALEAFFTDTMLASLRDDDQDHLLRVFTYLIPKLQDVVVRLRCIDKATVWDRATWAVVGKTLQSAEEDIYEWVQRLQYSLMLLPATTKKSLLQTVGGTSEEAMSMIKAVDTQSNIESRVAAYQRLGQETTVSDVSQYKLDRGSTLSLVPAKGPQFITSDGAEQVVEFKKVNSAAARDPVAKGEIEREVAKLISLFSQVAADQAFLLRPTNFFASTVIPTAPFGITYQIPPAHKFPVTLADLLATRRSDGSRILTHSLDQRFELARQIATALLFVHSTGWFHKGVCASNVVLLYETGLHPANRTPACLGKAFLVGFDFARDESRRSTGDETAGSGWDRQIYQHPARAQDTTHAYPYFLKEYDIYALGALLVEIGRWKPLSDYPTLFKDVGPVKKKHVLEDMACGLSTTLGRKYVETTLRCLRILDTEHPNRGSNPLVLETVQALQDLASATR